MISSKLTFNDFPEIMATILERLQILQDLAQQSKELSIRQSPPEPLITQMELARYLDVSVQTIIRWKRRKKIPFLKSGSTIRYNLKAVLSALGKNI